MDEASDGEPGHAHETNNKPPPFEFDDAFSDGEEHGQFPEFSPDAIREEMARNHTGIEDRWVTENHDQEPPRMNGLFDGSNVSVSTLDLQRSRSASSFASPPPQREELSPTSGFSNISLSEDRVEEPEDPDEHTSPYPNVVIDASNPMPSSAEVITQPPRSPGLQIQPPPPDPEGYRSSPNSAPTPAASLADKSPPLSTTSPPSSAPSYPLNQKRHRPTRSIGPSAFEKVVSKTRPTFLPPKSRKEDDKHLADWQSMMKQSRSAAEKKRKALQERRLQRESRIEESLYIWQKEIVPDWKVVHKNPAMRKLWWSGIPTKLRAPMWEHAVGNALSLSKDNYRICLARAKRAFSSGTFPTTALGLIEQDIEKTLPVLHIFHPETGPLYQDLKDMLCAWVVSRSDEGLGYVPGASRIAAMILINMQPQQGFIVMRNLLERHCMRSFYGGMGSKDDVEAYCRIFDTLLADGMPKIYFNFKQHQISPFAYLPEWLIPLFLDHLPFEACARIWDVLLLEGDSFLFRAALGILAVLEPRLFFPDRRELLELLKGENKPALEAAKREGRDMNGGRYEIYGVDEETLWERIDSMEEWWKESTWTRLMHRELPDL